MRVTYCTRVVQKPCLLFLLKIAEGLKFILHYSENKSLNFKIFQKSGMYLFFLVSLQLEEQ